MVSVVVEEKKKKKYDPLKQQPDKPLPGTVEAAGKINPQKLVVGGQALSREEYNLVKSRGANNAGFNTKQGGGVVGELSDAAIEAISTRQNISDILRQRKMGGEINPQTTAEEANAAIEEQNAQQPPEGFNLDEINKQTQEQFNTQETQQSKLIKNPNPLRAALNTPQVLNPVTAAKGIAGETFETGINTVAKIYDFMQSLFSGGKSLNQKEAEASFTDAKSKISSDMAYVRMGLKEPSELKQSFIEAASALNRLEGSVKGAGKYNLRYRLLNGIDIQTQIRLNRQYLQDVYNELEMYRLQGVKK